MKKVVKIVTFYDDGTFTESTPSAPYSPMPLNPAPYNPSTPYGPIPNTNPWVQPYPYYPPYTITCKTADGTIQEINLTSPIVAQTT